MFPFPRPSVVVALLSLFLLGCVPKREGVQWIQFSFWGSIEQQRVEREIVRAFEAENPDIKVNLLPVGSRYAEKIQAMMVGRIPPDVVMVEMGQYMEWAARDSLLDITEDVLAITSDHPLMPVPQNAFELDGRFFAFPINCSGQAMYYNADALRQAGITPDDLGTWEDIRRLAPRLSKRAGNPDALTDYALLMPSPLMVFWAFGGELFDSSRKPQRATVESAEAAACIQFLRSIRASGFAVPPDVSSDQGTYQLFRDGKVALYFDGRWRTPNFVGQTKFNWDVRPAPAGPHSHTTTMHGGTGLAIAKDSRNPEAARRFIRFYVSEKGVALTMRGGRYVPVYRDMALGDMFLSLRPPEHIRVFAETMEEGASRFVLYCPGAANVTTIFGGRIEQALSEPTIPATEILRGLNLDLTRWLEKQNRRGML